LAFRRYAGTGIVMAVLAVLASTGLVQGILLVFWRCAIYIFTVFCVLCCALRYDYILQLYTIYNYSQLLLNSVLFLSVVYGVGNWCQLDIHCTWLRTSS
jgi:hypothetical protein